MTDVVNIPSDKFVVFLESVAEKLGYTVGQIYQVYTRGQFYEGMISLLVIVCSLAIFFAWIFYWYKKFIAANSRRMSADTSKMSYEQRKTLDYEPDSAIVALIMGGLILGFLLLVISGDVSHALLRIMAPEYTAIKQMFTDMAGFMK